VARSSWTPTAGWPVTAAGRSRARTPPRWIGRRPTPCGGWPRTSSRPSWRSGSRYRSPTRSARRLRSGSSSRPSVRRRSIWTRCRRRWTRSSTCGPARSSVTSTSNAPSTRRRPPTVTSAAPTSTCRGSGPTAWPSSGARPVSDAPTPAMSDGGATMRDVTTTRSAARVPATDAPVARVLPLLGVPHLDREFDYLVPESLSAEALPGTRVRVRFAGRLVDAFLLERAAESGHRGELAWLERVISPEPVLTPDLLRLVEHVARRWVGMRSDVLRLAIPPRHATAEKTVPEAAPGPGALPGPVELPVGWSDHPMVARFLEAVTGGLPARAVWTAPPGRDWASALAALADTIRRRGLQVLVVVPDQRDVDRLTAACREIVGGGVAGRDLVADLSAGVGPSARYRRWLRAVRGHARIVVGTRSAVFTPLPEPGLMILHDDGDDSFVEPRAPYPHTRDVAPLRASLDGTPLLLTAVDRTPEIAELVRAGWAHEIRPEPGLVRSLAPRVVATTDLDPGQARDVAGGRTRLPAVATAMAREAIDVDAP